MSEVIIYTMDACPYCEKAKKLLESKGYDYEEKRIAFNTKEAEELIAKTQFYTLPQIFIGGEFIGGSDDLEEYFKK